MIERLLQNDPNPPSSGGGGIDIGWLVDGIVHGLLNGLGEVLNNFAGGLWVNFINALGDGINQLWQSIWGSGANLLATPFALTVDYPPARLLGAELAMIVYGVTSLAIVLLALRNLWRSFSGGNSSINDAFSGVLVGIMLAGAATLIISQAYLLTGLASDEIGQFNYVPAFDAHALISIGPAFVVTVVTILLMMIYGFRLMLRAAYRIVLLMFLTPFAPIAGILWAIPQLRWVSTLYFVTIGGWLAGGFLAIGAISLGVQIAAFESGGSFLVLVFGIALVQLAYDLLAILPRAAFGAINTNQLHLGFSGAAVGAAAVAAGAAGAGATGAAAAGASAASGGSFAGMLGSAASIGALPGAGSLGLGYD